MQLKSLKKFYFDSLLIVQTIGFEKDKLFQIERQMWHLNATWGSDQKVLGPSDVSLVIYKVNRKNLHCVGP